jgi:hypothetical protein
VVFNETFYPFDKPYASNMKFFCYPKIINQPCLTGSI